MQMNFKHLLLMILGIALAFLMPMDTTISEKRNPKRGRAQASTPSIGGVWSNERFLQQHLANALVIVPKAAGMQFVEEPKVRVGTAEDVAGILRADFDAAFRKMGAKNDAQVAEMSKAFAQRLPAVYDPAGNMIYILPENAVNAAATAGDESLKNAGVLRLLLVRMAAIALDRQHFPDWKTALDKAESVDALHAASAMLQGHAQYVTERVVTAATAPEWTALRPDFDRLVALLITPGPQHPLKSSIDGEIKFSILKGHEFMTVLAKKKGMGGIKRHLNEPPTTRTPLFDPAKHFGSAKKSSASKGKLPEQVIKEFEALHTGEGWTSTKKELVQADADALLEGIEPQYTASIRAAFQSGTAWTYVHADTGSETTITLIEMRHPGPAESLVSTAQGATKKTGAEIEEGSGRDSGLPGFVSKTEVDGKTRMAQWTYEGKYVLGIATNEAEPDRDAQDDALEAAAEVISKSQKSRTSNRRKKRRGK